MPFFQSITSLFGRGTSPAHPNDAFDLPTTQFDAALNSPSVTDGSPGPSRRSSFQPGQQQYPPPAAGSTERYPPLSHTFHRLRFALGDSFPELLDSLNPPALPGAIMSLERTLGCPLPPAVRESFLQADGQELDGISGGLFYGLYLLPLDEVRREWEFWRTAEADPNTGANPIVLATMASVPPQWVKSAYACRGWLPLLTDRSGNYVGVDLDPGPGGSWGQIIIFGRDFDRKCVVWRGEGEAGWAKWFASIVDEIESGDGWEADRSSDDEEELGYSSYNGGASYGNRGGSMRLAGQYKGWQVLEAWWDKSVRKWEGLGLGMDVAEIERGMDEARRLTRADRKGKGKAAEGDGDENAQSNPPSGVTSPRDSQDGRSDSRRDSHESQGSQDELNPASPHIRSPLNVPHADDDEQPLFPPASPDQATIPRILHPSGTPTRKPAALNAVSSHPLKQDASSGSSSGGFLSPPARSSPGSGRQQGRRGRPPPPAPSPLDLPTRADVQASQAVAEAEAAGLRGGWVMNLDVTAGATARRMRNHAISPSLDAEMVDIDLESGRGERFGTPPMVAEDERDDRASLGLAQRRDSRSPVLLNISRTPSPLSRTHSFERMGGAATPPSERSTPTPRGEYRISPAATPPRRPSIPLQSQQAQSQSQPLNAAAAAAAIRPPPPIGEYASPTQEREREVIRGPAADQRRSSTVNSVASGEQERGNSVNSISAMSTDSQEGLLDRVGKGNGTPPRVSASPPRMSPPKVNGGGKGVGLGMGVEDVVDGMEEVNLG